MRENKPQKGVRYLTKEWVWFIVYPYRTNERLKRNENERFSYNSFKSKDTSWLGK